MWKGRSTVIPSKILVVPEGPLRHSHPSPSSALCAPLSPPHMGIPCPPPHSHAECSCALQWKQQQQEASQLTALSLQPEHKEEKQGQRLL